jgi:hypothetical protein
MRTLRNAFLACLLAAVVASAAVDPALLNLVPADAKFVFGVQVESAKSSAFGKYVLGQMQSDDPAFTKFIADTGFDPRRDLSEIVASTSGTQLAPLVVAAGRGTFNPGAILSTAQAHGAKVASYNGIDIITHSTRGSQDGALAFLSGSIAAIGTLDAVHGAIDRFKSGAVVAQGLATRVNELAAAYDAWFLSTVPVTDFFTDKVADAKMGSALQAGLLQAVLQANGGLKFGVTDIKIGGEALTRSAKDASALADVVRFLAGMIQVNREKDPNAQKVATLLDTMTLATNGATVQISLTVPEALVEQLFVPGAVTHHRTASKHAAH